jgi:signal transduction histidine kinase
MVAAFTDSSREMSLTVWFLALAIPLGIFSSVPERFLLLVCTAIAFLLPYDRRPLVCAGVLLALGAAGVAISPHAYPLILPVSAYVGLGAARLPLRLAIATSVVLVGMFLTGAYASSDVAGGVSYLGLLLFVFAIGAIRHYRGQVRAEQAAMLTSLQRANSELRAAHEQLRLDSLHTAELAAAEERARIAREIHDVLAHTLTTLVVQANAGKRLATSSPEFVAGQFDLISQVAREGLAEARRSVQELRSPGEQGLSALTTLVDNFSQRTGIACALDLAPDLPSAAGRPGAAIYRLTQEALTNAVRHGQASHIAVAASQDHEAGALQLTITDDGIGASATPPAPGGGNGLRGVSERITALGGDVTSGPLPAGGYQVHARIPLAPNGPAQRYG